MDVKIDSKQRNIVRLKHEGSDQYRVKLNPHPRDPRSNDSD